MPLPVLSTHPIRTFYFWTGIIATVAYRVIIFFSDAHPWLLKGAWYVGTVGFILYFAHRYQISQKRAQAIAEYKLAETVTQLSELSADQKTAMAYVFQTLSSTREKWNYIFIFVLSGIALVAGILMDLGLL